MPLTMLGLLRWRPGGVCAGIGVPALHRFLRVPRCSGALNDGLSKRKKTGVLKGLAFRMFHVKHLFQYRTTLRYLFHVKHRKGVGAARNAPDVCPAPPPGTPRPPPSGSRLRPLSFSGSRFRSLPIPLFGFRFQPRPPDPPTPSAPAPLCSLPRPLPSALVQPCTSTPPENPSPTSTEWGRGLSPQVRPMRIMAPPSVCADE